MTNSDSVILKTDGITEASRRYCDNTNLQVLVAAIPYVGGPLDILLRSRGAAYQQDRIRDFLQQLHNRMKSVESGDWIKDIEASEALFDIFCSAVESSIRTRSKEKRRYLAAILSQAVTSRPQWEEAEEATRLVAELSELHIQVLAYMGQSPAIGGLWDNLPVVAIDSNWDAPNPSKLIDVYTDLSPLILQKICSDLIARGLILDEGIGRVSVKTMTLFRVSDFGLWLIGWLQATGSDAGTGKEKTG